MSIEENIDLKKYEADVKEAFVIAEKLSEKLVGKQDTAYRKEILLAIFDDLLRNL